MRIKTNYCAHHNGMTIGIPPQTIGTVGEVGAKKRRLRFMEMNNATAARHRNITIE